MVGDRPQQPQPNFPSGQYPNMPPHHPAQGQYPGMQPQYPAQGQYPGMQPQYPAQGQYPSMQPQYPAQGQYPGMQPQYPAQGQYPDMPQAYPAPGQYPKMQPQYPAQGQYPGMPQAYPAPGQYPKMPPQHSTQAPNSSMSPQYNVQAPNQNIPSGDAQMQNPHQQHCEVKSAPPMPQYMVICDDNSKMKLEFMNSKPVKALFPLHATTINTICNSTLFNSSSELCVFLTHVANICVACSRNGPVLNETLEQINKRKEKLSFRLQASERFVNEIYKALQIAPHHDPNIFEKLSEKGYINSSGALEYAIQLKFARKTYRAEMASSELKYNLINNPDFNMKYLQ
ncbi:MAG: hypothetical protein MHMPM18_001458 [Marteilia pararefringens]